MGVFAGYAADVDTTELERSHCSLNLEVGKGGHFTG
jgi:hypothetical protein